MGEKKQAGVLAPACPFERDPVRFVCDSVRFVCDLVRLSVIPLVSCVIPLLMSAAIR